MPTKKAPTVAATSFPKATPASDAGSPPADLIDARIRALQDWRGGVLSQLRRVITGAHPDVVEEWKWNTPVWSCDGIVCTGETYQKAVKLTFAKGASLADPAALFNSSLSGNTRRAIDFKEGSPIDAPALEALVQAAVALNRASVAARRRDAT
jgi:hypothetical protein